MLKKKKKRKKKTYIKTIYFKVTFKLLLLLQKYMTYFKKVSVFQQVFMQISTMLTVQLDTLNNIEYL